MKQVDIYFSYAGRGEDGTKTNEISIAEALTVEWDGLTRKYQASNPDSVEVRGQGATQEEAIVNYLKARLGMNAKPQPVRYSRRIY
jgi:hypothetical protein